MISALTSMILEQGGNSRPLATSLSWVIDASASAASRKTSSEIDGHCASDAACPTAGKMYALLACAGVMMAPLVDTNGSNGDPLAKITLPLVHLPGMMHQEGLV